MGKYSALIYHDYAERFKALTDAQFGQLIKAALIYDTGELPVIADVAVSIAFGFIKMDLDKNRERLNETSVVRAAAGAAGGVAKQAKRSKTSNCLKNEENNKNVAKLAEKEKEKEKDKEKEKAADAEDSAPALPPAITLPLNDGSEYPITQTLIDDLSPLYPAVDTMQQFRGMKAWLISNPTKRKTKTGIMRFINAWLSREQDKGRASPSPKTQNKPREGFERPVQNYDHLALDPFAEVHHADI